jgi:hypothetical protein
VVKIEKGSLRPTSAIRIPEHRHHIGEIIGCGVNAPIFPIDELDLLASTIAR